MREVAKFTYHMLPPGYPGLFDSPVFKRISRQNSYVPLSIYFQIIWKATVSHPDFGVPSSPVSRPMIARATGWP